MARAATNATIRTTKQRTHFVLERLLDRPRRSCHPIPNSAFRSVLRSRGWWRNPSGSLAYFASVLTGVCFKGRRGDGDRYSLAWRVVGGEPGCERGLAGLPSPAPRLAPGRFLLACLAGGLGLFGYRRTRRALRVGDASISDGEDESPWRTPPVKLRRVSFSE